MEIEDFTGFDTLTDFVCEYMPQYSNSRHMVKAEIKKHWAYGTLDYGMDSLGISYAMRYNISFDGKICDVLDLVIRPDKKGIRFVKYIIARNWSKYKNLECFRFYREGKYPLRESRQYKIKNVFKVR